MTPLAIYIATMFTVFLCVALIYFVASIIIYLIKRNRQQYIERTRHIKRNRNICYETARDFNIEK